MKGFFVFLCCPACFAWVTRLAVLLVQQNKNLYITELERLDASDKLGAKFGLSSTIQFWGFTTRQFVSIKSISESSDELKCNIPVVEVCASRTNES